MGASTGGGTEDEDAEVSEINVTPFIDVMLVLLIVFMVAAPLSTVDVPVNLPGTSAQPQERPDEPLWLSLGLDRVLSLGNEPVPAGALQAVLDEKTGGDRETAVFFRADKEIPYGELMVVLDELRNAGYLKVALVGLEGAAAAAGEGDAP
ncbi:TonB system transport protein ExbD [Pseudogemmobacter humi]|uniref:Biopolymer transport protein ExbD n=1 Tax=Pseudogemmobacter humi TaxID=2483812 RepID=A0A3P5XV87_9RHOB|nr:TonB system transport protein ExbD [Pseudogemmobacter humi]VDC33098.1 Biopolymer transport protein ExbD [Pseudogemmobacter humi]